jgi:hypothetical protein
MVRFSRWSLWRDSAALRAVNRVRYAPAVQTWIFSAIPMAAPASGTQRRRPFFGSRTTIFGFSVTLPLERTRSACSSRHSIGGAFRTRPRTALRYARDLTTSDGFRELWMLIADDGTVTSRVTSIKVKGADSSALDAMVIGLRKMKENPSSSRRLAKASREERPNIKA